jgi:pimeloyl-ACP methyl ester carboxylesterase
LASHYRLIAPDYPALDFVLGGSKDLRLHIRSFGEGHAGLYGATHLDRYTLFMQDYGGPVGFQYGLGSSERIQAMIIQNAVSHEGPLSSLGSSAVILAGQADS